MTEKLKVLDLFSGIGGFSLGLERTGGFETVAFCEIEEFPQKVLKKHWPEVPIYEDVRQLTRESGPAQVDLICGGYPCQPFSTAGKRKGAEDDRHLWPEVNRLLAEYRPAWFIGENVAGHVSMGLDDVLSDLEAQSYTARAFVVPACALNASHRRDRLWIVANANGARYNSEKQSDLHRAAGKKGAADNTDNGARTAKVLADTECRSLQTQLQSKFDALLRKADSGRSSDGPGSRNGGIGTEWAVEPELGRVANGVPNRAHRLKSLGNAVVPQIPEMIGYAILEAEAA